MRKLETLILLLVMASSLAFSQTRNISGKVTDANNNEPLPGVSVVVKGTTIGTVTDIDGIFHLQVNDDAGILMFSFIGMNTEERPITSDIINVSLKSDTKEVDEVVVTALGIKKEKKALGYAVQEVGNEEIAKTGNANLATAMQGKLAGVDIKPSSGMPGASSQMVIRGARSFTGDNTPLYIVDGQPIASTSYFSTGNSVTGSDISNRAVDINPADIESINILKGQAAAALYGIRASNGVVIITTKSGKGAAEGKAIVNLNHTSSFDVVSRTPDFQTTYAQGSSGAYVPNTSMSWGPKITELPNDATYGGNSQGYEGKYYVPQRATAGLDPWVTPKVYDNYGDYFGTGYTATTNASVTQATKRGNFAISIGNTNQSGIAPNTGMNRWNGKVGANTDLNEHFKAGFSANFVKLEIDKLSAGNDASLAGVYAAPASYDLKGIPSSIPGSPYEQIYYRGLTFDNPYWIKDNNTFNEKTDRFFGNGHIEYNTKFNGGIKMLIKYQLGIDTYTTHYQDIFGYGSKGGSGSIDNYGVTSSTYNSLLTANFDWTISDNWGLNATFGNELNHQDNKQYDMYGLNFNAGGWNHINNTQTVTVEEKQRSNRTVGIFGSLSLSYKSMLYFNATGRNDVVSIMPRGNRSFFYPSVSLGFVASELAALRNLEWLSFAKIRASYAEVGQAGQYYDNYYTTPVYDGSWWNNEPITYPAGGTSSFTPSTTIYDTNLKPQNTRSYEIGVDLKFLDNRLGIDYTYSRQDVKDQIFPVPLAGSTGLTEYVTNGGKIKTNTHEVVIYITPIKTADFTYDMQFNFARMVNEVVELKEGVESIFLGGYVTPQVRAGIGMAFPVIYGDSFLKDDDGNIIVIDDPGSASHGMPQIGDPDVIGSAAPDFILGHTSTFEYKSWSLSAVFEWKEGGQMYSGSNGLLDLYGMSATTEDRTSTFIYPGVKPDGTPNDIVRGGEGDELAYQQLYSNILGNIDEYYIKDNSFVKLREIALRYNCPKRIAGTFKVGINAFARNILLWTELENFDPESSQGNNNMGGAFERFSMPQTTSYGFGVDVTF